MAKVMVSFPDDLLAKVDEIARARNTTRSGYLQALAVRDLQAQSADGLIEAMARVQSDLSHLAIAGESAAATVRADRDSRDVRHAS